jgi:hypothetical protein
MRLNFSAKSKKQFAFDEKEHGFFEQRFEYARVAVVQRKGLGYVGQGSWEKKMSDSDKGIVEVMLNLSMLSFQMFHLPRAPSLGV